MNSQRKIEWHGKILSIQPRTRVWRYVLDNRTHTHIGYNLFLDGTADGADARFAIAISEKQQQTGGYRIGPNPHLRREKSHLRICRHMNTEGREY